MLETPNSGIYRFDKELVDFSSDLATNQILRIRRATGMVFQSWNLFPHLTILQNITEGPVHVLGQNSQKATETALELLHLVGLDGTEKRYPSQLSGGQQQRISICRALAMNPEYLLFDEPTSALDPELETQVLLILEELSKMDQSMIIVTHNMQFARSVADKIVFVEDGDILFDGAPDEFFNHPTTRIKDFLSGITFDDSQLKK